MECIGKGKARNRYEFGVKTSIATINEKAKGGQFVVGKQQHLRTRNEASGHAAAAIQKCKI